MPSHRSSVTPTEIAQMLGSGVAQTYLDNSDWLNGCGSSDAEQKASERAEQEAAIIVQGMPELAPLFNDETTQQAFVQGFTSRYMSG